MAKGKAVDDEPFDPSKIAGDTPDKVKRRARKPRASKPAPESDHPAEQEPPAEQEFDGRNIADGEPSLADDVPPIQLTPEQWKVLERCAGLDENDADNGKRLLRWFGDRILNVHEAGWHAWTGTHWDFEAGQYAIERFAHELIPLIKREAGLIEATPEEAAAMELARSLREEYPNPHRRPAEASAGIKIGEAIAKHLAQARHGRWQFAVRSGDRARTSAMIAQAEPHRTVNPRVMDLDDLALNTPSGTLRFSRELDIDCPDPDVVRYVVHTELEPHRPGDMITKITTAKYEPDAKAPLFMRDLARYVPDAGTREFLQVAFGYAALGLTGEQVFFFLHGDGGNWKSACTQAVGRALGSYTKPMMYSSIAGNNMPSGDKPSPDWARLPGVRFLTVEEVPRKEPLREELIKLFTSGSDMPVRHLNRGIFDMRPTFSAILLSNAEPNIAGSDDGIWRRIHIIKFEVAIPTAERKPFDQVMDMYAAENAGILNWIVKGTQKYLSNGLEPYVTDQMRSARREVRRDRNAVDAFVEDCVQVADGTWVTSRQFYQGFVKWCGANGVDPVPSETSFGIRVKRVQIEGVAMEKRKRNIEGVKRFIGIRLVNIPDDDPHPFAPQ